MPVRYHLALTVEQRQDLEQTRDHAQRPYQRERAAVILAVAAGQSLRAAARTAGLKPHRVDTVCAWVHRYQAEGLPGLGIRTGRGRKPASFRARPADAGRRAGALATRRRPTA